MAGESFRVVSGNAAGTQIQLEGEFQIGRAAPAEGRLGDDPELSRAHAKVYRDPQGRMVIEDLGSTNGTAVNGQRISGPTVLNPGDTVQVGKTTMTLQGEGGAPGATLALERHRGLAHLDGVARVE
ncbi:MAG TPA: FHA domain-containing protein, partial [Thermoleophilaceae bacterium]|nr:FHA domain-containing protein [Thermoleophilaceae bacterium]